MSPGRQALVQPNGMTRPRPTRMQYQSADRQRSTNKAQHATKERYQFRGPGVSFR